MAQWFCGINQKLSVNEISQQTVKAPESSRTETENLQSAHWIKKKQKNILESNYSSNKSLGASLRGPAAQQPINKQTQITEKEMLTTASIFPRSHFVCLQHASRQGGEVSDRPTLPESPWWILLSVLSTASLILTDWGPPHPIGLSTDACSSAPVWWKTVEVSSPVFKATCPSEESQASLHMGG